MSYSELREELLRDGYCRIPGVLDAETLDRMRGVSGELTGAMSDEDRRTHKYTGSMISLADDERFSELIAYAKTLEAFQSLGFEDLRWTSGYVISKPPHSPSLFWHQDWGGWNEPESYEEAPLQLFAMFYLVDTTPENGCLRVIPGTHVRRHQLHEVLAEAHSKATYEGDESSTEHEAVEGEVDVPVMAGDLVIGDARLLHASHPNDSDASRTVVTIWYIPGFGGLSASLRRMFGTIHANRSSGVYEAWSAEARERVRGLLPPMEGAADGLSLHRVPDAGLLSGG